MSWRGAGPGAFAGFATGRFQPSGTCVATCGSRGCFAAAACDCPCSVPKIKNGEIASAAPIQCNARFDISAPVTRGNEQPTRSPKYSRKLRRLLVASALRFVDNRNHIFRVEAIANEKRAHPHCRRALEHSYRFHSNDGAPRKRGVQYREDSYGKRSGHGMGLGQPALFPEIRRKDE